MLKSSTKQKNIPELRFSGFGVTDPNSSYKKYSFNDIFLFSTGKNIKQNEASPEFEIPCIRYGELYYMYGEVISKIINRTNLNKSELTFSQGDEILLPSAGEDPLDIGLASALTVKDVAIGRTINILKPAKKNVLSQVYVSYYINHRLRKKISTLAKGNSISNVYNSDLRKLEIILPSLPEQQKTADFFVSVDALVDNLRQQRVVLETYKCGMMQKFFSQEIRFKNNEGINYPAWKSVPVGSFLKERKEYSVKGNGLPHISLTIQGVVPKSERYHRDFLVNDDEIKKYKITRLNDLCYNPANLKFNVIAINKLGDGIFSPIYVTYEICDQDINFVGYYLTHSNFIKKARRFEEGTVYERMAVNPKDFVSVEVAMPVKEEQEKISNFLASIDFLIREKQKQIMKAETWKKGLFQKMFI